MDEVNSITNIVIRQGQNLDKKIIIQSKQDSEQQSYLDESRRPSNHDQQHFTQLPGETRQQFIARQCAKFMTQQEIKELFKKPEFLDEAPKAKKEHK